MSRRFQILFAGADGWSLSAGPGPVSTTSVVADGSASPSVVAAAVLAALESDDYDGSPIAVCVPSAWCMSATISTSDLPRGDARAMMFRLEESLPVAAENVIADFVPGPTKESALGVCIRVETIAPIVAALEAAGVAVQSVVPTAIAVAVGLEKDGSQLNRVILCGESGSAGPGLNVIALVDGRPVHWSLVTAAESDLKLQFDLMSAELGHIPPIEAVDVEPSTVAMIEKIIGATVVVVRSDPGRAIAVDLMSGVLAGRDKPWINFRRGRLAIGDPLRMHRKWIDLSIAAAILLLLGLTTVFLLRASRYARIEAQSDAEMAADFRHHFPTWQVPMNIPAVVDAQYRQSSATGAVAVDKVGRGSTLTTLRDVLVPMSSGQNFQIEQMSFHDNGFVIRGRLQSYDQIDVLSKAVRSGGMVVSPAQTHRESDGTWTFVLQGSRPATAAAVAQGSVN